MAIEFPRPDVSASIERYLAGRATDTDIDIVQSWAAANPENADLLDRMTRAERVADAAPELWNTDAAWLRLKPRLRQPTARPVMTLQPQRSRARVWLRAAAMVVLLLGGALLWQKRADIFAPGATHMQEYAAAAGKRVNLRLPDGSTIVLGSSSRLWLPERFGNEREVRLEGEAVFDVAPDAQRPFLVRTGGATTRVLGTRFGVTAFPDDNHIDVTVAEGRVAVVPVVAGVESTDGAEVTAGHAVRVSDAGALGDVRAVNAEALLSWATGGLAFERASLAEVARTIERRFGIRVTFADASLAGLRVTADFGHTVNAAEVLQLIAASLSIEVHRTDDGFSFVSAREGEKN